MVAETVRDEMLRQLGRYGELLYSPAQNQLLLQVRQAGLLLELADFLHDQRFYLVTVVANDERELEDRRFKLYYMFSHPAADLFVLAEYLLEPGAETYPSIHRQFAAVDCFEREIRDLLGLRPQDTREAAVEPGSWLHGSYPDRLHPLRREHTTDELARRVAAHADGQSAPQADVARPRAGSLIMPVGPVHAGIIEPGQFLFTIAGEAIEDLDIRLGYTHKGIERIFQSRLSLLDGWRLAEQVSGDSSFAHALAYCRAAETLTDTRVPPAAELLRGLFLELERIHNHVGDVAALAEDVALEWLSSELTVVREQLLRLNKRVAGHRYLRRLNRPGGVALPAPLDGDHVRATLRACLARFGELARRMKGRAGFRDRTIGIGILTREQALDLGVTGMAARACGIRRDCRWDHPTGLYGGAWLRADPDPGWRAAEVTEAQAGDVYARFLTRVEEVQSAHAIVEGVLDRWDAFSPEERNRLLHEPHVLPENNYTFAVGYVEGFRGDVVYWLMQDKMNGIYRCKVRDPSMLNWPALRRSVLPGTVDGARVETVLADFPLVNKSFNLSYSGNDL